MYYHLNNTQTGYKNFRVHATAWAEYIQ